MSSSVAEPVAVRAAKQQPSLAIRALRVLASLRLTVILFALSLFLVLVGTLAQVDDGIWTVVDFHQDIYSEVFCGDGFPGWTVPTAPAPHHDCPGWGEEYLDDPDVKSAFENLWAQGSTVQAGMVSLWDRIAPLCLCTDMFYLYQTPEDG